MATKILFEKNHGEFWEKNFEKKMAKEIHIFAKSFDKNSKKARQNLFCKKK